MLTTNFSGARANEGGEGGGGGGRGGVAGGFENRFYDILLEKILSMRSLVPL